MSNSHLPERASLEYLKKLAKDRLRDLRQADPRSKLAAALLAVARDHGFPSWRALKAELDQRQSKTVALFFEACADGDVETLRGALLNDPGLVGASPPGARHQGWTALHTAAKRGHVDAVRLLLDHGAEPNAREAGDNTCALHWAAAHGHFEVVRALIDAGGDVHGSGDVHELDVIGWATVFAEPGGPTATGTERRAELTAPQRQLVSLLLERGARHHIFSAISVGDLDLIRNLVEQNPEALDRRMSRFEQRQTPLHFAMSRKRYDILDLLIELGADLEAEDGRSQTALAVAMLSGDRKAMRRLHAAGAEPPKTSAPSSFRSRMAEMAGSIKKGVPSIRVADIAATLDWYASIGFKEIGRWEDEGVVKWGMVSFGKAELALDVGGRPGLHDVSLWFETDEIDQLYQLLKARQLEAARAALADAEDSAQERVQRGNAGVEFEEDLYDPFYGGRQFSIRDLNGYRLIFLQPAER